MESLRVTVMNNSDPYIRLAELIDLTFDSSIGPQDESRAFVRFFKRFLTEEEVTLILYLTDSYQSAKEISGRSGRPLEPVQKSLTNLAARGFIFENSFSGVSYYMLMAFTPGIFEAVTSVDLDSEGARFMMEFISEVEEFNRQNSRKIIYSGVSIRTEVYSSTLEEIELFLDRTDTYAVTDCLCRYIHQLRGTYCGHPIKDICIQTGSYAEFFIRNGHSRRVGRDEVMKIFLEAEAAGLYHEIYPIDYENGCAFICNCCKCGCLVLRASGRERSIQYIPSSVSIDPELCTTCGACMHECPEQAVFFDPATGKASVDKDLCFDCGLCMLVCNSGAIS